MPKTIKQQLKAHCGFVPKSIVFKHEGCTGRGAFGPVWFSTATEDNPYKGKDVPVQKDKDGFAEWTTLKQATKMAKNLGLQIIQV